MALASRQLPIYAPELWDDGSIDTMAIGTGPAILTDVEKEAQLTFESNPDYWQGKPYLDGAAISSCAHHAFGLNGTMGKWSNMSSG